MIKKLKIFNKEFNYNINTAIFNTYIIILCLIFVGSYFYYGRDTSQHYYFKCPEDIKVGYCENPIYVCQDNEIYTNTYSMRLCNNYKDLPTPIQNLCDKGYCKERIIKAGESIGEPAPIIIRLYYYIVGIGLIFCLILNHLLYNKHIKLKNLEIELDETNNKK